MSQPQFVPLGVISGAHGVRGAVKIRVFTADFSSFLSYSPHFDAKGHPIRLKKLGEAKGQLICSIDGVQDRNQAEALRQTQLGCFEDALSPAVEEDEYYIRDLEGLSVYLADGAAFGTVKAVVNYGAGDIVEIAPADGSSTQLYAFTHATFPEVDVKAQRMVICPPEILPTDPQSAQS